MRLGAGLGWREKWSVLFCLYMVICVIMARPFPLHTDPVVVRILTALINRLYNPS